MPTRNINLTDRYDALVEDSIRTGQFANASEVVRAGLRLLEQNQAERTLRLDRLRADVQIGIAAADRGETIALRPTEVATFLAKAGRRATKRSGGRRG